MQTIIIKSIIKVKLYNAYIKNSYSKIVKIKK